jgi:hypothetical protein
MTAQPAQATKRRVIEATTKISLECINGHFPQEGDIIFIDGTHELVVEVRDKSSPSYAKYGFVTTLARSLNFPAQINQRKYLLEMGTYEQVYLTPIRLLPPNPNGSDINYKSLDTKLREAGL